MAPSNDDYAIEVDDVTMIFNIASEQLNNLKEYFIKLMRHELFFKEFRALDHVSFKVRRGEVVGLVGTNGSGKSTMLKCIAGVLEPSEGSVTVRGKGRFVFAEILGESRKGRLRVRVERDAGT